MKRANELKSLNAELGLYFKKDSQLPKGD